MKRIILITSGGSQLLSQLSILEQKLIKTEAYHVEVFYNGVYRDSLNVFFEQACELLGIKYLGQFSFNVNPEPLPKIFFWTKKNKSLTKKIETNYPFLKAYRGIDIVVLPVRVKMFSDITLLNYLNPSKVFYCVDGVIDYLPERNFLSFKYRYLKTDLKSLPFKKNIFSPPYLKKDVERVGVYKEISISKEVSKLSEIKLAKSFKKKYLKYNVSHIIFSQHYSLSEGVKFENEIEYYLRIVKALEAECFKGVVLFKPHPRDTKDKIDELKKYESEKFIVISSCYQALPIEIFRKVFLSMGTIYVTGNSSAPFCFETKEKTFSFFSKELLTQCLNHKIINFASFNDLQIIEV